jgi:hypothetical protein
MRRGKLKGEFVYNVWGLDNSGVLSQLLEYVARDGHATVASFFRNGRGIWICREKAVSKQMNMSSLPKILPQIFVRGQHNNRRRQRVLRKTDCLAR